MLDIYAMITDRILAELEKGVIPWRKTWKSSEPINYVTRKAYRGVNLLLLPYGGEWLSFLQVKQAGGYVRKGEKSSMVVFYKMMQRENQDTGEIESYPFLQYTNVFHLSQVEGVESKLELVNTDSDIEPIETAQTMFDDYISRSGVKVDHIVGSNKACYTPSTDTITLPVIAQFTSREEYYSTAFHEGAHSTGNTSRLDRLTKTAAFGSGEYSKEELIAEISACNLVNIAGIELPETFCNSVAYIQSWARKLKDNKRLIVEASSAAQKSTDMILGITSA